eukprot:scaffold12111_cov31-Tisochrysis_lutea.AAC.2
MSSFIASHSASHTSSHGAHAATNEEEAVVRNTTIRIQFPSFSRSPPCVLLTTIRFLSMSVKLICKFIASPTPLHAYAPPSPHAIEYPPSCYSESA